MSLTELFDKLEAQGTLPPEVWHEWLWGSDPEEAYHMDVLLNRNQLLGLLVCRYKHLSTPTAAADSSTLNSSSKGSKDRMTIMDIPVPRMTWRELKDTVANILFEWPQFLGRLQHNLRPQQNLRQVMHLITQCACRFGHLAFISAGEDVMDDPSETQPSSDRAVKDQLSLTPGALRRMVGSLLIMYRHLHLLSVCVRIQPQKFDTGVSKYHYEASTDAFNLLCMHMALPVAARLNYRHDFPGMYNHVSQVVYFHNSQYTRCVRRPLEEIQTAPAAHVLPAIQELYPEIRLRYEEDMFDPTKPGKEWCWLLLAGRVYLMTPEPRVLFSENVTDLLKVYVDATRAGAGTQEEPVK
jgi:hypothetical protein